MKTIPLISSLLLVAKFQNALAFCPSLPHVNSQARAIAIEQQSSPSSTLVLQMGFFDGISKAFTNQEFKAVDQRVRASHILIKGDDDGQVLGKINLIMGELNERMQTQQQEGAGAGEYNASALQSIFAELARRDSQCPSGAEGGDLGLFAPGKMVREFDEVLFPEEGPPPVGSIVGPVVTDFGCHVILVTQREIDRNQVEEKLARND